MLEAVWLAMYSI